MDLRHGSRLISELAAIKTVVWAAAGVHRLTFSDVNTLIRLETVILF